MILKVCPYKLGRRIITSSIWEHWIVRPLVSACHRVGEGAAPAAEAAPAADTATAVAEAPAAEEAPATESAPEPAAEEPKDES